MIVSPKLKTILSFWGVALLVGIGWYYYGDNSIKLKRLVLNIIHGNEIHIGSELHLLNTDLASVLYQNEGTYQVIVTGVKSDIVLVQKIKYDFAKMIDAGVLNAIPVLNTEVCQVYTFSEPEITGVKSITMLPDKSVEILSNEVESKEMYENIYCKLIKE